MDGKRGFKSSFSAGQIPAADHNVILGLKRVASFALTAVTAVLALGHLYSASHVRPTERTRGAGLLPSKEDWDWKKLGASRALEWHKCFDDYDCAKLDVPMDWLDPSDDARVHLAIIRLPATSREDYRGPIFVNPGGPGGAGTDFVRARGGLLQTIAGNNHDLIGFDPRGVGASSPLVDCWGSPQRRFLWSLKEVDLPDAHPGMLYDSYAHYSAFSGECEETMNASRLLEHMSTASHARDMLGIAEAMGLQKVKYWGFSYGTLLGGTFAAMFPNKVDRLVSDGNIDYEEWYNGTRVGQNRDSATVLNAFYYFCHKVGAARCALYDSTTGAIAARIHGILESLKQRPLLVRSAKEGPRTTELVTYSKVKWLIFNALYSPIASFGTLADIMADLERGNGAPYWKYMNPTGNGPNLDSFCSPADDPDSLPSPLQPWDDAFAAIMCADGPPTTSADDMARQLIELGKFSNMTAPININSRLYCAGRKVRSRWRFTGPFQENTSFPILFIGNHADNVTPLTSARYNSQNFPGSVVLTQYSYGHTSLTTPSRCTAAYVRAYFQDGTLPESNTTCGADVEPFQEGLGLGVRREDELGAALRELSLETGWLGFPRI